VSTSSGHWRVRSPQRRRRLWSALLGGILLVVGFRRRPADLEPTDVPELAKGRPPGHVATKARRAWMEIARLLYSAIGKHRVVSIAAGVTFFVLLAIFPAIGALVSIYGIFADPTTIQAQLNNLSSLLPGGAIEIIGDQLQRVTSGGTSTLGLAFLVSLAIALWSANAGILAIRSNLFYIARMLWRSSRSRPLNAPGAFIDADVRSPYWRDRDRDIRDASLRPLWVAYSGAAVLPFWRRAATPTSGAA
jgi:hypothetical protein